MKHGYARLLASAFALAGTIALLAPGAASPHRLTPGPSVDIQPVAGLAPDGRSMTVSVFASCPERWSVVEASVAVSQPQASGQASFPLVCIGSVRGFAVDVPAAAGTFDLGDAQVTASVVIKRGRTESATDAQVVRVEPRILVELADTARLESGGSAVVIEVTVACPVGGTGLQSSLNVSQQGISSGNGSYVPVCDGSRHTFSVTVQATQGLYHTGEATALTFANTDYDGTGFYGVDDGPIQIVS